MINKVRSKGLDKIEEARKVLQKLTEIHNDYFREK